MKFSSWGTSRRQEQKLDIDVLNKTKTACKSEWLKHKPVNRMAVNGSNNFCYNLLFLKSVSAHVTNLK